MTPPTTGPRESPHLLRKDMTQLASSISAVVEEVAELKQTNAIRQVEDRHLSERLGRIEKSIEALAGTIEDAVSDIKADVDKRFGNLSRPIWIAITALISTLVAAGVTFVTRGGPLG